MSARGPGTLSGAHDRRDVIGPALTSLAFYRSENARSTSLARRAKPDAPLVC